MSDQDLIAICLVVGGIAVIGAIARFFVGAPVTDVGENVGAGCMVIIPIALVLGVLYGIVRFVKFAWSD